MPTPKPHKYPIQSSHLQLHVALTDCTVLHLMLTDSLTDLHFHYMNGVPATLDLLCVPSLLDEDHSRKAMVQVPQVHRTNTTLKITAQERRKAAS